MRHDEVTPMVKRLSCLPSKQAARVRLPFGVLTWEWCTVVLSTFIFGTTDDAEFFLTDPDRAPQSRPEESRMTTWRQYQDRFYIVVAISQTSMAFSC